MRNRRSVLGLLLTTLMLVGCGDSSIPVITTKTSINKWTWVGGSNTLNSPGDYGTVGVASAANVPPAGDSASAWTDSAGTFWLFGNGGNNLWKFSGGEWTWVDGLGPGATSLSQEVGIYGTLGTPAPGNIPGQRQNASSWTDAQGNLWLFGGYGFGSTRPYIALASELNDLWQYKAGEWTWMSGANYYGNYGAPATVYGPPGSYGIKGVPDTTNVPGVREYASTWTDAQGSLWLFGGEGVANSIYTYGEMNDLWKYSGGQWTWMGGSQAVNPAGVYGTLGVAASTNVPGARAYAATWTDKQGNFWLFGGYGYAASSASEDGLNDLWKYSGGQWTWMGGSQTLDQPGTYGTQGVASATNIPGTRTGAVTWTDVSGNLWLFGGDGYGASTASEGTLNDLWKYSNGQWTWVSGSQTPAQTGSYGTLGVAAYSNVPPSRYGSVGWTDASGNLWLFGGLNNLTTGAELNDLWEYQP